MKGIARYTQTIRTNAGKKHLPVLGWVLIVFLALNLIGLLFL